jgi:hypothetical protein
MSRKTMFQILRASGVFFTLSMTLQAQTGKNSQADEIFDGVKSRTPSAKRLQVDPAKVGAVGGRYTDVPPGMPSLQANDLYLFPDQTYFYVEWTDVFPSTITDKGEWAYKDGLIELRSDKSAPRGDTRRNDKFLPLYLEKDGKQLVLLLGASGDFAYFKEKAEINDEFMLLLCTYNRVEDFGSKDYAKKKSEIYEKWWRPESVR